MVHGLNCSIGLLNIQHDDQYSPFQMYQKARKDNRKKQKNVVGGKFSGTDGMLNQIDGNNPIRKVNDEEMMLLRMSDGEEFECVGKKVIDSSQLSIVAGYEFGYQFLIQISPNTLPDLVYPFCLSDSNASLESTSICTKMISLAQHAVRSRASFFSYVTWFAKEAKI